MLFVSQSAMDDLYSSTRVILCDRSLLDRFRNAVPTGATVIPYRGDVLGDRSSGSLVQLADLGLPLALEMIVSRKNCSTVRQLLDLAKSSGFPRPLPALELGRPGWPQSRQAILEAYQEAMESTISAVQEHGYKRESEVVALRRRVEAQTLTNNHLTGFLNMLGYAAQELALEQIPDLAAEFLPVPITQRLPMLLSDVAGISIYAQQPGSPTKAVVSIATGNSVVFRQITDSLDEGWHDLFFPSGFLRSNQDATLTIDAIEGNPRFAAAKGRGDITSDFFGAGGRSAALRIWRHTDPHMQALQSEALAYFPRPTTVEGRVLAPERLRQAAGGLHVKDIISIRDDCFVQTHCVADEITNFVIRDLVPGSIEAVEAMVYVAHPKASPVRFMLLLLPQQEDRACYEAIRLAASSRDYSGGISMAEVTLGAGETHVLTVSGENLDPDQRYCLALAVESPSGHTRFAWAQWRYVALRMKTTPQRQTYRFSHLAALSNQIQYADGPIAENALNKQLGFPVLATTDGDQYLQTHPVEDHVVAVRLDSFVPAGMQRLWIEISNHHERASPTEFGVLLSSSLIEMEFSEHYANRGYGALSDDWLHSLPDGGFLKKTVLQALEKATLEIFLTEPLNAGAHLYLFVKTRSGGAQYGWCRWHRLAMTIFAPQRPNQQIL